MRFTFLLLSITLGWISLGHAQMFLSIQECDARYGKAVSPTDLTSDVRFYLQEGLSIKILFVNDKAAVITFKPVEPGTLKKPVQEKMLADNAGGNTWEKIEGEGSQTWQRSDGLAFATFDPSTGELTILSTDYVEKIKSEAQSTVSHP